jgi:NAD(P)H-hydrate epimerase
MRVVTAAEMKELEAQAARLGVPEPALMATAGAAVAAAARALAPTGPVAALVGSGNNGGDALVAAAHLLADGRPVALWTVSGRKAPSPVAEAALAAATRLADVTALAGALAGATVVLDGLYGTGLSRAPSGPVAEAIAAVNAARARPGGPRVLAIDVPSGMMADTGVAPGATVVATATLALGFPKRGLYLGAGPALAGRIAVAGIGLPEGVRVTDGPRVITTDDVRPLLPQRPATADKYTAGAVLVIGGALPYPGAPRLSALGALRAGAGYVTLAVPRSIYGIVAGTILEATYLPLPETDGDLGAAAAESLGPELGRFRAAVIGPGLGREKGVAAFLQRLLAAEGRRRGAIGFGATSAAQAPAALLPANLPLVLDADALNHLSQLDGWHERLTQPAVLTPNHREMARLTDKEAADIDAAPWDIASAAADQWRQVVVLKGAPTIVAAPDGRLWTASRPLPALATAGSGDVLSGVIGALLAQGLPPADAAVTAVHLGELTADLAVAAVGVGGVIASDLPLAVAQAMRSLLE